MIDLEKLKADDIPAPEDLTYLCLLCGNRKLFDRLRYSVVFKICSSCSEVIVNLWYREHRGRFLTWLTKARKKPVPQALRWAVFKRDGYKCQNCRSEKELEADHILAESRGGKTTLENLRTLCRTCNAAKGDRLL